MTNLPAGASPSRELAKALMHASPGQFEADRALSQFGAQRIAETEASLKSALVPLRHHEPKLDGSESKRLVNHLRVIGMKVRPEMSEAQAGDWCRALLTAFSDLPSNVAAKAAADAIHTPFRFPNEVEARIRELADERLERIRLALRRLEAMQAIVTRATNNQPRLAPPPDVPLTDAEVHAMQRGPLGGVLIRMGLAAGHIRQDQLLTTLEDDCGQAD